MLTSDKAPYIVALLVTVLGWHVSQLTEGIRAGHAVGYQVAYDETSKSVRAEVRNSSRTKPIVGARFALVCKRTGGCFESLNGLAGDSAIYGWKKVLPPTADLTEIEPESRDQIEAVTTLAAGGVLVFGGKTPFGRGSFEFYFKPDPDANQSLDLYIYRSDSIQGFFIENYFLIVLASLAFLLFLFVIAMTYTTIVEFRSKKTERVKRKRTSTASKKPVKTPIKEEIIGAPGT
jgi:hypothetical protein